MGEIVPPRQISNNTMTIETLEKRLNEEYKDVGTITVNSFEEREVPIMNIQFVDSIMKHVDALDIDEPIVLDKNWNDSYTIIDGYHRVKSKLNKGESTIKAYVLSAFQIKRKTDILFSFVESLVNKTVVFLDSNLLTVDGKHYQIIENAGCGGCGNGWSSIKVFTQFLKVPIKIASVKSESEEESDVYKLIINGKHIADVDTGWGNGYYGGDFKVHLII